jgi:hypothetical protein
VACSFGSKATTFCKQRAVFHQLAVIAFSRKRSLDLGSNFGTKLRRLLVLGPAQRYDEHATMQ